MVSGLYFQTSRYINILLESAPPITYKKPWKVTTAECLGIGPKGLVFTEDHWLRDGSYCTKNPSALFAGAVLTNNFP